MVYVIPSENIGQPDIISFSTEDSTFYADRSAYREASMYYIKDGRIERVKIKENNEVWENISYTEKPKVIGTNLYQLAVVYNADAPVQKVVHTYSFNPETGIMTELYQ